VSSEFILNCVFPAIISSKDESSGKTTKRKKSKLDELPSNMYDDECVDPSEVCHCVPCGK